ncbi:MAG TPA: phage minor head protein [Cyclobacteriaceae bacterium]|nr:phage minor head protein [Cyclobacteriaceae bacterium]
MNKAQRTEYSEHYAAQSKRIERKCMKEVMDALEWQVKQALPIIKDKGPEMAIGLIDLQVFNSKIEPVLTELHVKSGLFFANKGLREINKQVRTMKAKAANFGFNDEWADQIIAYFQQFLLNKSVYPISLTTKEQIIQILEQASREGWGYDKIAAELSNPRLLLWRARRIVRTENTLASHFGLKLAAGKSEYETGKEWISAMDHRTRHGHRRVDGEVVDEEGKFAVGVYNHKGILLRTEMMFGPGDPEASAENVINCRCTSALVARRDERGRLIPKQTLLAA